MRKINTAVLKAKGENEILMSSTNTIEGKKLEVLGLVRGASIYSRYSHKRMEEKANEMSVDVIVGSSYSTYNLIGGAAEIIVYVWYSSRICLKARGIRDE